MRRGGRLQANSRGIEEPWLCPSHPENQKLEIDSMVELARRYDVDGLHFDYIRYPDSDHCFCAGCQKRFQQATGLAISHWPTDVLVEGSRRQPWLEWRRGRNSNHRYRNKTLRGQLCLVRRFLRQRPST